MRFHFFSVLFWAALGESTYLKRDPQSGNGTPASVIAGLAQAQKFMQEVAPNIKAAVVDAKPQIRPNASRKLLRFGPHTIPGSKVRHQPDLKHMVDM
jgi:hypothetical protein